jgi:hypothetical protein
LFQDDIQSDAVKLPEGPAFGSKKELIFLCIVVQSLSFITQ